MADQMELVSGEISAVPGTPTSSNDTQVQQRKTAKSDDFPWFLFYMYFLSGMYIWSATTYVILTSRFPTFSPKNFSPTCPEYDSKNPPKNIYEQNFSFDLHVIISENGNDGKLIWKKSKLTYGDLDSAFSFETNVSISERARNNGCLHLYACLTQSGFPFGPKKGDSWAELYTYCKTKRLIICLEANKASFSSYQVRSYWRPNWTVNLVGEGGFVSFPGKEDGRVDCDPLTSKFYPLLYLNDNFNLARHCIAIDQTTEWLPLNLSFKQIGIAKLWHYLSQRDFDEYFKLSSVPYEEFIRRNLVASDFETTGLFHVDYFLYIVGALFLTKCILFAWAGFVPFNASAILFTYFYIALLPVAFLLSTKISSKETVKSEDSPKGKECESSTEVPFQWDPLLNFLRLEGWVIFRNLAVLLLVHLLCLYLCYFLGHLAFSAQKILDSFYPFAAFNCFLYLVLTLMNIGDLPSDWPVPTGDSSEPIWSKMHMHLDAIRIATYSQSQLFVLIITKDHYYPLAAFSTPAFLAFAFIFFLSDLAFLASLFELGSISKLKNLKL